MAARLRDKIAEVFHEIGAHGLLGHDLWPVDGFPDQRIDIFLAAPEFEEERLVVDAGTQEIHLVVGHVDPLCEHLAGTLHAVTQTDMRAPAAVGYCPAIGGHWVDVVEQQRVGGVGIHIVAQVEQHGDGAQRAEDAARPQRIADALFDTKLARDVDVEFVGVEPALLKGRHDIVGAGHGFGAVGCRNDPGVELALVDHRLHDGARLPQATGIDVHERDRALLQRGRQQDVAAQIAGEDEAARPDKGDFWHELFPDSPCGT